MNFKDITNRLTATLEKYQSMLIYIKGSPDPDVIASSFALKILGDKLGVKTNIVALTEISLPQNKAIIDDLNIPIHFEKSIHNISNYDAYSILDHQSAYIKGISEKIPCAIHIDHHESVDELVKVDLKIAMEDVGSVSTIMALVLKELNTELNERQLTKVATALLYGIQTDTDRFKHATHLDYEAINYLYSYSDKEVINSVNGLPLPIEMIELLGEAIKNQVIYKDWLITGIGFIDESYRDNIALIADLLLDREKATTVTVFAGIEKNNKKGLTLDASMRTEDENIDLNEIIRQITSEGGARRYKGAYQIDLNYFVNCPDKSLLWDVINKTTIEVIKRERNRIHLTELKGFYRKFKKRVTKLLKI